MFAGVNSGTVQIKISVCHVLDLEACQQYRTRCCYLFKLTIKILLSSPKNLNLTTVSKKIAAHTDVIFLDGLGWSLVKLLSQVLKAFFLCATFK